MKYRITCVSSGLSKQINSLNYTKLEFSKIVYFYGIHTNYSLNHRTGDIVWKIKKS